MRPFRFLSLSILAGSIVVLPSPSRAQLSVDGAEHWSPYYTAIGAPLTDTLLSGQLEPLDLVGAAIAIGDFNGDSHNDLAIGIPFHDLFLSSGSPTPVAPDSGQVIIVYGMPGRLGPHPQETLHQKVWPSQGSIPADLQWAQPGDEFGASLTSGDFNGDGLDDLAVGAPGQDVGNAEDAGMVRVYFGTALGLVVESPQTLPSRSFPETWTENSPGVGSFCNQGERFGSVLESGDFNRDGYDDLVIGVPQSIHGFATVEAGAVHVLFGGHSGFDTDEAGALQPAYWHQDVSGLPDTPEVYDNFGAALATGDFDGDLYDDLAIGIPGESQPGQEAGSGAVQILKGYEHGLIAGSVNTAFIIDTTFLGEHAALGSSLATGDFDGDGKDDLAAGMPNALNESMGVVNVYLGAASSGTVETASSFLVQGFEGLKEQGEAYDHFGSSLASGDFDLDGFDDLVVGTPGENLADGSEAPKLDAGIVQVYYGEADGLATPENEIFSRDTAGFRWGAAARNHHFGRVLRVGDLNGDEAPDLAVGIPSWDASRGKLWIENGGAVNVFYSATGLFGSGFESGTMDDWDFSP